MKITFIPFTRLVIAKFRGGKYLNIRFNSFPSIGIWCITIGRIMIFNDWRKLYEYSDEIEKMAKLNGLMG